MILEVIKLSKSDHIIYDLPDNGKAMIASKI